MMRFVKLTGKERSDLEKMYKRTLPVFAFIGSETFHVVHIPYVENKPVKNRAPD
jgi:hypothetical protein